MSYRVAAFIVAVMFLGACSSAEDAPLVSSTSGVVSTSTTLLTTTTRVVLDGEIPTDQFGAEVADLVEKVVSLRTDADGVFASEELFLLMYSEYRTASDAAVERSGVDGYEQWDPGIPENLRRGTFDDGTAIENGYITCIAIEDALGGDPQLGMEAVSTALQLVLKVDLNHAFDIMVSSAGALCEAQEAAYVVNALRTSGF